MIELRWVEVKDVIADIMRPPTKKLQYRTLGEWETLGETRTREWSEWIDVATVKEE